MVAAPARKGLKRERKPPQKWRRNMAAAAAFLAILDTVILSAAPNTTRIAFALVVTIVVGYAILRIWLSNIKLEKAAADLERSPPGGSRPPSGSPGKKRQSP
jgi:hypothetical protein